MPAAFIIGVLNFMPHRTLDRFSGGLYSLSGISSLSFDKKYCLPFEYIFTAVFGGSFVSSLLSLLSRYASVVAFINPVLKFLLISFYMF